MRIIALVTEAVVFRKIHGHPGEQTSPPVVKPARGPPWWEMQQHGHAEIDPHAQALPAYEFDQRIAWVGQSQTSRPRSPEATGNECVVICAGLQVPATQDSRLTTAEGHEILPKVALERLSLAAQTVKAEQAEWAAAIKEAGIKLD